MEKRGGDVRLRVTADGLPWSDYAVGDSIAVKGVCLTAVRLLDDGFDTDVSVETLDVTTLKQLAPGDAVNLEPALRVGDALGGHLVGHVAQEEAVGAQRIVRHGGEVGGHAGAGRAGRHMSDGTFGASGDLGGMDGE